MLESQEEKSDIAFYANRAENANGRLFRIGKEPLFSIFYVRSGFSTKEKKILYLVEWHISWYLNFLPGNRKNDWFPAKKHQENQEKIYCC